MGVFDDANKYTFQIYRDHTQTTDQTFWKPGPGKDNLIGWTFLSPNCITAATFSTKMNTYDDFLLPEYTLFLGHATIGLNKQCDPLSLSLSVN